MSWMLLGGFLLALPLLLLVAAFAYIEGWLVATVTACGALALTGLVVLGAAMVSGVIPG